MREDTLEQTGAVLNTQGSHWSGAEYVTGNWSEGRGARHDLQGHRTKGRARGPGGPPKEWPGAR